MFFKSAFFCQHYGCSDAYKRVFPGLSIIFLSSAHFILVVLEAIIDVIVLHKFNFVGLNFNSFVGNPSMVFKNHSTYSSSSGSHRHDNLTAGMGSMFTDSQMFWKPVVIFYY